MAPRIHLAFRFHVNFYHSYRGDTPDELGFGKDIRVIRHIIDVLDRFNADGCPVRGTWDIENAFSLGDLMPRHGPDLIAALQRRVREGRDEIEVMSYNNGLISAHTAREFEAAIRRAITNPTGSGLQDLFDEVAPVVRPQEMMFTPLHLKLYAACGIEAISLFYSAVPFNSFSNFVPPLSLVKRHNPLTLTYPGITETLSLIPAYNHGDIADHLSLRRWVRSLRRRQLTLSEPTDLLLLIDADADDDYWVGYDWPIVRNLLTAAQGLEGLVRSVADLDYLTFTTPYSYLRTHPPVGSISFGQDTADGNYDGYASWAEKWSNHRLWTGIDRSRLLEQQTRALMADELRADVGACADVSVCLDEAFEARLRALSTTHFGLAAPVMNRTRLGVAADLVADAFEASCRALALATDATAPAQGPDPATMRFELVDYVRGTDTDILQYKAKSSKALICLPVTMTKEEMQSVTLRTCDGDPVPIAIRHSQRDEPDASPWPSSATGAKFTHELCFVAAPPATGSLSYTLDLSGDSLQSVDIANRVEATMNPMGLTNGLISLTFDPLGNPVKLHAEDAIMTATPLFGTAIRYAGRLSRVGAWRIVSFEILGEGLLGAVIAEATLPVGDGGQHLRVRREYLVAAGLPYLYLTTDIAYPRTSDHTDRPGVARRLERAYDDRWQEVMPCEITPGFVGRPDRPLRIWKHNYLDHVSTYDLSGGTFEDKRGVDAFNNQITHGWLAATDGQTGLLIGASAEAATCLAFSPMRIHRSGERTTLSLNPFGTYDGRQMVYPTAATGLGKRLAILMTETLRSPAPSYAGHHERFALLLAPYAGDAPPAGLQANVEAFAYPYALLSTASRFGTPTHRTWSARDIVASTDTDPDNGTKRD